MMFFSAALNLVLGLTASVALWGTVMSLWAMASKLGLFAIQYGIMRFIGHRRGHGATAGVASTRRGLIRTRAALP